MKLFKLKALDRFLDRETDKIFEEGEIFIVDEARGGALMRRHEKALVNEIYELPFIEIENPSDLKVSARPEGVEVILEPKSSIVIDKILGALILKQYSFLLGKEYIKPKKAKVRKRKATKRGVKKVVKKK